MELHYLRREDCFLALLPPHRTASPRLLWECRWPPLPYCLLPSSCVRPTIFTTMQRHGRDHGLRHEATEMLSPSSISSSSWIGNLWPAQSSVGEEAATATRHESSMHAVTVRRWCSFFGVGELRIRMWRGGQGMVVERIDTARCVADD